MRNHWRVENKLHWYLEFTFIENKNTTMNKKALMNLQLVNKFCLGILNKIKPFYKMQVYEELEKEWEGFGKKHT